MDLSALVGAELVWFGAVLLILVVAYRTSVRNGGLLSTFVPFAVLVFTAKHWSVAGKPFLVALGGYVACLAILLTHPDVLAPYLPSAYGPLLARLHFPSAQPPPEPDTPQKKVAAAAAAEAMLLKRDELLEREAAYNKHAAEVNATYAQLTAARAKLKGGGPALAAFNAKAAQYQQSLVSLQSEKTSYDALQRTVQAANQTARAGTQRVANLAVAAPAGSPGAPEPPATRGDLDAAVARIRAIVNQVPAPVIKPRGAESWTSGFHPGAIQPDFDHVDLLRERQVLSTQPYMEMQGAPNVFYRGDDCEFNPQTKFFYTNRELPKKKLSDAEYGELTRLYRFVGKCERDLNVRL